MINDVLINEYEWQAKSRMGLAGLLRYRFGTNVKALKDIVMILIATAGGMMSYEQFFYVCGGYLSSIYGVMKSLVSAGYLIREEFIMKEGNSQSYYSLTREGYKYANSLCNGSLDSYRPPHGENNVVHSYYVNWIGYQMLMINRTFSVRREVHAGGTGRDSLRIDAYYEIEPSSLREEVSVIYEQDMGTETIYELLSKLERYEKYDLMNSAQTPIIFSIAKQGTCVERAPLKGGCTKGFSVKACRRILKEMDKIGTYDLDEYEYLMPNQSEAWKNTITSLREILCWPERRTNLYAETDDRLLQYDNIKAYTDSLQTLNSPYQQLFLNMQHNELRLKRMGQMFGKLIKYLGYRDAYAIRMMKGQQVLFVVTTLIAGLIPYVLPGYWSERSNKGLQELEDRFGRLRYRTELSQSINLSNGLTIRLRNELSWKDRAGNERTLYVENMFIDMAAWLRVYLLIREPPNLDLRVLCLFDDLDQMNLFFRTADIEIKLKEQPGTCPVEWDDARGVTIELVNMNGTEGWEFYPFNGKDTVYVFEGGLL